MQLERYNQLMLLFLSLHNPLWGRVVKPSECVQEKINSIARVQHGSLANWRKGKPISLLSAGEAFNGTKKHIENYVRDKQEAATLTAIIDAFSHNYFFNTKGSAHEGARLLSMPTETCQKIIDEAIYHRRPIFPDMYYENSSDGRRAADQDFSRCRGLFHAWMRRGPLWLCSPLHVRYVLKIHDGLSIRCKMSLPIIEPESQETFYDYDGFLVVRDHKVFWMLQKREPRRNDFVYFITCSGRSLNGQLTMAGKYLTTGQDANSSIVSSDVLIRRMVYDNVDEMYKRIHEDAGVADEEAGKEIEQLWEGFSS